MRLSTILALCAALAALAVVHQLDRDRQTLAAELAAVEAKAMNYAEVIASCANGDAFRIAERRVKCRRAK